MGDYDLLVKITGDASNLISALGAAGKNVSDFSKGIDKIGKGMTIVGGAVTAAFALIIKKTVDTGDAFNDMSLRTGIAVEELSALAYAGKQTGTDIEAIELSLKFLTRAMDDTSRGIGTAKDTFAALGISVTDTEGKLRPTVDVMKDVATAVAGIDDPAKQAAIAMELFGARSGTQLVPLLKLGEKGIDDLMKKAEELGIILSTKDAQAADEFKDKMNDLKEVLGAAARSLANVLIPSLTELSIKAVAMIKKIREWADEHKTLIEWIVKLGAGLGALAMVGGPILLAVNAFMKMKLTMLEISAFSKATFIPSMEATGLSAASMAGQFALITANVLIWTEVWKEFNKAIHSHRVTIEDSLQTVANQTEAMKKLAEAYNLTDEEMKKAWKNWEEGKNVLDGIRESIKGVGEQSGITGEQIKTFDEIVAGWAEETKTANEAVAKSTEDLANIMQPTYDKLYEMSHTAEEIAVKALNAQRDAQIEAVKALNLSADAQAAALAKIAELYNIEVGLIIAKLEEEKNKQIEVAIATEKSWEAVGVATRKIRGEYDPLIAKLNELATVTEASAARQVTALRTVVTAQGALLTNIPIQSAGSYEEAQAIVAENKVPKLQTGTPLVTKSGLALIDKGEAVLTPQQNKSYQGGGNKFTVIINNPIVRSDDDINKIRNEVKKAHEELVRQYGRTGYAPAY